MTTLCYAQKKKNDYQDSKNIKSVRHESHGEYFTKLRPGAEKFLEELMKNYQVYAFTAAEGKWQEKVLETLNVLSCFKKLYSTVDAFEILNTVPKFHPSVLVDDADPWSTSTLKKMRFCGYIPENFRSLETKAKINLIEKAKRTHLIKISSYVGQFESKSAFSEVISEIKRRFLTIQASTDKNID